MRNPVGSGYFPFGMACILLVSTVGGCGSEPDIAQYTVDKQMPVVLSNDTRMLGAIVPNESDAWFFKVTGETETVEQAAASVRKWVSELKFANGEPELSLPDGWTQKPASSMRFATLEIPIGDPPLEVSVSKLAKTSEWSELVQLNVNRWRGQLGLEPSEADLAGGEILGDTKASEPSIWIDLVGQSGGGGMMSGPGTGMAGMPPMAGMDMGASMSGGSGPVASIGASTGTEVPIEYEIPEGWRAGKMSSMRWAAFNAGPEDRSAEITVIPAGGDTRGNIERWMGQISPQGMTPADVDTVIAGAKEITVDGIAGQRFFINGNGEPKQAIDATILPLGEGFNLFIKMTGDAATVSAESDAIQQFLDSLKLKS